MESRLSKTESENERLEKMIREKEAKIVESERVAKNLMLKAEEFEDMFIGKMTPIHKAFELRRQKIDSLKNDGSRTTGHCEESSKRPQRGV